MRNVVIVDSVRTGLAKSFRGGFNQTRADNMTAHLVNALLERNPSLKPEMVEDMILGCGAPEGAQGHNIARNVAVLSNLPIDCCLFSSIISFVFMSLNDVLFSNF